MFKKYKAAIMSLIAVVFITGCQSTVEMVEPLTEKSAINHTKGIVTAKVINAGPYPLPFNQLTITPDNFNESKEVKSVRLQSVESLAKGTTFFASEVKTGTYALSSIRSFFSRGDYWYSKFAMSDAQMGTFDVKPGQVTDLGTLIYYPKPDGDLYKDVLVRIPSYQNVLGATLAQHFPFFALKNEQVLSWHEDERDEERNALYTSIVQNPVLFGNRVKGPNGDIHFLSKLGVILTLTPNGEFLMDAVDTNDALTTLAEDNNGSMAIADATGNLFYKKVNNEWQKLEVELAPRIFDLKFADSGELEIISSQLSELHIQRLNLDTMQLTTLNTFDHSKSWQHIDYTRKKTKKDSGNPYKKAKAPDMRKLTSVYTYEDRGVNYISIRGITLRSELAFGGGETLTFSYDPRTWSIKSEAVDKDIDLVLPAGTKKLGIEYAGFWSWNGQPAYYLLDDNESREIETTVFGCMGGKLTPKYRCSNGKKSLKKKSFSLSTVPVFLNDNEAYTVGRVSGSDKVLLDAYNIEDEEQPQILKTIDGGEHWIVTGNTTPKKYCTDLVPEVDDKLLIYCNGANGDFYESFDEGKTWQQVREQVNF